jgi:hypothetical protein
MWQSFPRKVKTAMNLVGEARSLFLLSYILLPLIDLSLRLRGVRETTTTLAKLCPARKAEQTVEWSEIRQIVRMVKLAAKYSPPWITCLRKSLVLWYLLRRKGIETELQIGSRLNDGKFEGHAWIEYQGIVLNDNPSVRESFVVFKQPLDKVILEKLQ